MGIVLSELQSMVDSGYLKKGFSFLDIGSSNLYSAPEADLLTLLESLGQSPTSYSQQVKKWENGAAYGATTGGKNETFVGDVLNHCEIDYLSLDIADGYKTKIFDLNNQDLDRSLKNKFNLVANYGTTEHLLNQMNAFKVIHDATSLGGVMIHQLPAEGFVDHCYVRYTARFFFDLVSTNDYELLSLDFGLSPAGGKNIYDSSRDFLNYFPALGTTLTNAPEDLKSFCVPDIALKVCIRKVEDRPFRASIETSTSVGNIINALGQNRVNVSAFPIFKWLKKAFN
ncbi:hypothetical protein N9M78_01750 [Alphaproteobacteria bacterium]|nr:hypothetical protein [Alphaproteobacteria bacterium]